MWQRREATATNVGQCEFVLMPLLSAARPSQEVSFQDREGESRRDMRGQGEGCLMEGDTSVLWFHPCANLLASRSFVFAHAQNKDPDNSSSQGWL